MWARGSRRVLVESRMYPSNVRRLSMVFKRGSVLMCQTEVWLSTD